MLGVWEGAEHPGRVLAAGEERYTIEWDQQENGQKVTRVLQRAELEAVPATPGGAKRPLTLEERQNTVAKEPRTSASDRLGAVKGRQAA